MARGENNLLFNPPLIRYPSWKKGSLFFKEEKLLPTRASDLVAYEDRLILTDLEGHPHIIDGIKDIAELSQSKLKTDKEDKHPEKQNQVAVSQNALAWGAKGGFIAIIGRGNSAKTIAFPPLPGDQLGLHISRRYLYCLWNDGEKSHLSKASIEKSGQRIWQEVDNYASSDIVYMQHKGDQSILYYEQTSHPGKIDSIVTLAFSGPGSYLSFFHTKVVRSGQRHLITPAGQDNSYMALGKTWHNDTELMLLYPHKNSSESDLGRAAEKTIASIKGLKSKEFKDLASYNGQGLLFGNCELVLFDSSGINKVFLLPEEVGGKYDRLLFSGKQALLWREGSESFFSVDIS